MSTATGGASRTCSAIHGREYFMVGFLDLRTSYILRYCSKDADRSSSQSPDDALQRPRKLTLASLFE